MTDKKCHNCKKDFSGARSRCTKCRSARSDREFEARQDRAEQKLPAWAKNDILSRLRAGKTLTEAACGLVTVQMIQQHRNADQEWAVAMDLALIEGRNPLWRHGRAGTYRKGCRCPECREAKRTAGHWDR